jgi:phosphonopyruvate decarboxylase
MINSKAFYDCLTGVGLDYFAGVPDSLLKDICGYITDNAPKEKNIIAANEGGAVGLAIGYHLATNKVPVVYMQNSGFGNIINPLLSLADKEVYSVPMVFIIGWRGEPNKKDEPQHVKQGRVNIPLMDAMELPYCILEDNIDAAAAQLKESLALAVKENRPVGILIRKGIFEPYKLQSELPTSFEMSREDAVKTLVDFLDEKDIVVSTTGKTSRELYEYREELNQGHAKDFLTVGGMGHASQIALGIAQQRKNRQVYCFDGDGAAIMHLGSMPIISSIGVEDYKHIIINNGAHDSVGGQPTVGFDIDFCAIAKASGYNYAVSVDTKEELQKELAIIKGNKLPCLIEIKVNKGARKELGRPKTTPKQNKVAFMDFIKE